MSSSKVRKALEDYFKSMNSISEKVVEDIQLSSKEEGWGLFPDEEQAKIQWRKLIDPNLEEKYKPASDAEKTVNSFPVLIVGCGEKLVIDEDTSNGRPFGSSWKDEHSFPFSWETKSQLDLRLLGDESGDVTDGHPCTPKTPPSARSYKKLPTPKVTPRPSPKPSPALTRKSMRVPVELPLTPSPVTTSSINTEKPGTDVVEKRKKKARAPEPPVLAASQVDKKDMKGEVVNKNVLTLPVTKVEETKQEDDAILREEDVTVQEDASSVSSFQMDIETPSKAIPKTGFDFLDNW